MKNNVLPPVLKLPKRITSANADKWLNYLAQVYRGEIKSNYTPQEFKMLCIMVDAYQDAEDLKSIRMEY
jgi:hypothetical protein